MARLPDRQTSWALAWLFLLVLWLTWTPTGVRLDPELLLRFSSEWHVVLGNLALFAPIAIVWAATRMSADGGGVRRGRAVAEVAVVVAVLSLAVELGQLGVRGRSTSPHDVAMNTAGGAAAAWFATHLVRVHVHPRALVAGVCAAAFTGVLTFLTATGFAASRMMELDKWSSEYLVASGDELGGGRAYDGVVLDASICGGAPAVEVCVRPGAEAAERREVTLGSVRDQRARLAAVITSHSPQVNRARIVTFSQDWGHRNATLAQEGRSLVLRLRSPLAGPNGSNVEFVLWDAVREGIPTRVEAVHEGGRIVIRSDDGSNTVRGELSWGLFTGWWIGGSAIDRRGILVAGSLMIAAIVGAAAFSIPLGIVVAQLRLAPLWVRAVGGGLLPPVLLTSLAAAFDIPVPVRDVGLSAGFGLLSALVASVPMVRKSIRSRA